jgi:hypothetical protein
MMPLMPFSLSAFVCDGSARKDAKSGLLCVSDATVASSFSTVGNTLALVLATNSAPA